MGDTTCAEEVADEALKDFYSTVKRWSEKLKDASSLVAEQPPSSEPFKFIYKAVEDIKRLRIEIQEYDESPVNVFSCEEDSSSSIKTWANFLIRFALIHVYSCMAKWQESCEELNAAENEHKLCISLIEKVLKLKDEITNGGRFDEELKTGLVRCRYMYIYELTRYAILCSERENQDKALDLLKRAEEFYHMEPDVQVNVTVKNDTPFGALNSINYEPATEMFTYVLFYLGQAYRILDDKEKAVLYLHMVLRKQLDKADYSPITWCADTTKMASVVIINIQSFETARNILLAAQFVLMKKVPEEEKSSDSFKQAWADLGRCWVKLGVDLMETSSDRLKDLEEQTKRQPKFSYKVTLTDCEKRSLEINSSDYEFDTLLLMKGLEFPTLSVIEIQGTEMKGGFVRDFDEARAVFLPLQKWVNIAKEYYVIDEFASDYIDIMTDYSNAFKHLAFFEPDLERQIKMHRRRIIILEDLLKELNPKAYFDVFHVCLRDLAGIYEKVYKLKVTLIKENGESLKPKDKKLVKLLVESIGAHKRNLQIFDFDLSDASKDFQENYDKPLLGSVLSIGRILGSISHDHPHHESALCSAEEAKLYYKYFLEYLDRRPQLKEDFKILYDGSRDLPELLDSQIARIRQRLRALNLNF